VYPLTPDFFQKGAVPYSLDTLLLVKDSLSPPGLQMHNSLTVEAKE
jgi:hypothetical protein